MDPTEQDMGVTTLTEFLLERIAEDEAVAKEAGPDGGSWFSRHPEQADFHMYGDFGWVVSGPDVETEDSEWGKAVADHIANHDPARVLAECVAKRAVLALNCVDHHVLEALALPYANHPDYPADRP